MLTCASSKTRSHDVVGASGEAKMESSQGEGGGYLLGISRADYPASGSEALSFCYDYGL